ncbi:MAG: winged helix-turn-helix transcriptional regulator [Actinobacteria bacterium]|nr:winged helix-turn-helix transcriptional regulator [Actinomycetota bacterium]NIS28757.1 winged helix-turn-helix transcriptional regulator [Actinomycetota bacterium]NIT94143.1 winged helix-turn-helix transcriptional regulator [Actinomycetota bacterium]NIU17763.1 winged helix-turn-helix transcriptional regulator [Actinomycetota bacterium]NIU64219.1 winged helix-turn-helix transcriptional regulator [Actinomycetota bacterium]
MAVASDPTHAVDLEGALKSIASERRLRILEWLKDPVAHFPPQVHGDPLVHGACNQFIADKLGVSQPAASRHLKVLAEAGLIIATPRKGWTYYRRDEGAIADLTRRIAEL